MSTSSGGYRRWLPWLALVLLFAMATSLLAWWQFSRREERVEKINQVIENYDQLPVPIADVDWAIKDGLAVSEWRPVSIRGQYLPELVTLVRNRPLNGQAGFLQLVPFKLESGELIIIERGWLPTGSGKDLPDLNPIPSEQAKELVVRLRSPEQDLGRAEIQGQIASIHLPTLAARFADFGQLETRYYGRLISEDPASEALPFLMPKPSLSEGNHLSYAFQWVIFGLMAFAAFFWALRNERKLALIDAGKMQARPKRQNQGDIDAAAEDSLV